MCESHFVTCQCKEKQANLFFGKMLLSESSIKRLFCPACSQGLEEERPERVSDNGWVLELNMDIIKLQAPTFGVPAEELTADWVFDNGYVTWVGITPDDAEQRNRERDEIQELAKTDVGAYIQAMKDWGIGREKRFSEEGWRKMQG